MNQLVITIGQYTDQGRKDVNQDFYGFRIPTTPLLTSKGIAAVLADGISSSAVSHIASEMAVKNFLDGYFDSASTISVKIAVQQVLDAINGWLYAQSQKGEGRYNKDKGHVCTFSGLVIQSTVAHIFHIGDARVYRLRDEELTQLTNDHRYWEIANDVTGIEKNREPIGYLSCALGVNSILELDYHSLAVNEGDVFILVTDGIYEHVQETDFLNILTCASSQSSLDSIAERIAKKAFSQGSNDNLTIQIVRVDRIAK